MAFDMHPHFYDGHTESWDTTIIAFCFINHVLSSIVGMERKLMSGITVHYATSVHEQKNAPIQFCQLLTVNYLQAIGSQAPLV